MKKMIMLAALALAGLAVADSRASAGGWEWKLGLGVQLQGSFSFGRAGYGGGGDCYYPCGYGFPWPTYAMPQGYDPGYSYGAAAGSAGGSTWTAPVPGAKDSNPAGGGKSSQGGYSTPQYYDAGYQPIGYYPYQGTAPSYWYGR